MPNDYYHAEKEQQAITGCYHHSLGRILPLHTAALVSPEEQDANLSRPAVVRPGVQNAPVKHIIQGAQEYARYNGMEDPHATPYTHVQRTPQDIRAIGHAYDALPHDDPAAHEHYDQLGREIDQQYHHLTKNLGVKIQFQDEDPYKNAREMRDDLEKNNTLKVLKTSATGPHPYFSDEQNDRFRAVHDAFGHAATGTGFGPHGEEAAWVAHSRMFSPKAQAALTTETRGQNSFFNLNKNFAPQKVALLPEKFRDHTIYDSKAQKPQEKTALVRSASFEPGRVTPVGSDGGAYTHAPEKFYMGPEHGRTPVRPEPWLPDSQPIWHDSSHQPDGHSSEVSLRVDPDDGSKTWTRKTHNAIGDHVASVDYSSHLNDKGEHEFHIGEMSVDSDHTRRGLASALMNQVQDHAAAEGAKIEHGSRTVQGHNWYQGYAKKNGFRPELHKPFTGTIEVRSGNLLPEDHAYHQQARDLDQQHKIAAGHGWVQYYANGPEFHEKTAASLASSAGIYCYPHKGDVRTAAEIDPTKWDSFHGGFAKNDAHSAVHQYRAEGAADEMLPSTRFESDPGSEPKPKPRKWTPEEKYDEGTAYAKAHKFMSDVCEKEGVKTPHLVVKSGKYGAEYHNKHKEYGGPTITVTNGALDHNTLLHELTHHIQTQRRGFMAQGEQGHEPDGFSTKYEDMLRKHAPDGEQHADNFRQMHNQIGSKLAEGGHDTYVQRNPTYFRGLSGPDNKTAQLSTDHELSATVVLAARTAARLLETLNGQAGQGQVAPRSAEGVGEAFGGRGKPRSDPQSQGPVRQDAPGGSEGTPQPQEPLTPTYHREVKKDLKSMHPSDRRRAEANVSAILGQEPNLNTHPLSGKLNGWWSTEFSRGHRVVHTPPKDGGIHIGYVGLHDYGEAQQRLSTLKIAAEAFFVLAAAAADKKWIYYYKNNLKNPHRQASWMDDLYPDEDEGGTPANHTHIRDIHGSNGETYELHHRDQPNEHYPEDGPDTSFVLRHKGEEVGSLSYTQDGQHAHVGMLKVDAAHRGQNLAHKMMNALQDHAHTTGQTIEHGDRTVDGHNWYRSYRKSNMYQPHLHTPFTGNVQGDGHADTRALHREAEQWNKEDAQRGHGTSHDEHEEEDMHAWANKRTTVEAFFALGYTDKTDD